MNDTVDTNAEFWNLILECAREQEVLQVRTKEDLLPERDCLEDPLNRRNAARLLHLALRMIVKEEDLVDITKANVLRDLYDCRVCVNSISQVVLKGIVEPRRIGEENGFRIFDGKDSVSREEAVLWVDRLWDHKKRLVNII